MQPKKLTLCGMLTALAIVLSLAERLFPLDAIVPVPGVKLGLANVVTLFALTRLSVRDAVAILLCRVALSSLLMGSVTAFFAVRRPAGARRYGAAAARRGKILFGAGRECRRCGRA